MTAFFRKLFGARGAPAGDQPDPSGDSTEDWQPGDIAECVHPGPWFLRGIFPNSDGPRFHDRYRVAKVHINQSEGEFSGAQMLTFPQFGARGYLSSCFRKVRPQTDEAQAADTAFTDRLRRLTRQDPAPVPARELEKAALDGRCA